jgi:class 3 adenylate cyclase
MAVFNAVGDQPDHADRALGAARGMLAASERLATEHDGWPRFRAGLATGPAAVGHVGTSEQRSFTAIGDTTNLAARLQAQATPGKVVVAGSTVSLLQDASGLRPVGPLQVKGRAAPVEAYVGGRLDSGERPLTEDEWHPSN